MSQQFIKCQKRQFRLNMSIFAQMSPCMTPFGPKTRRNTICIPQACQCSLQIQLTALRQICILAIIFEVKQRTSALDLGLHHTGGSDFGDVVFDINLAEGSENGGGNWVADHEMALVVKGLGKGVAVDKSVAGGETAGGRGDDGIEVCRQFVPTGGLLTFFHLHS